jgi:hypothetical protein
MQNNMWELAILRENGTRSNPMEFERSRAVNLKFYLMFKWWVEINWRGSLDKTDRLRWVFWGHGTLAAHDLQFWGIKLRHFLLIIQSLDLLWRFDEWWGLYSLNKGQCADGVGAEGWFPTAIGVIGWFWYTWDVGGAGRCCCRPFGVVDMVTFRILSEYIIWLTAVSH